MLDRYLRQILDEGLRCGVVAPWAARFEDVDRTLGGYFIPKGVSYKFHCLLKYIL